MIIGKIFTLVTVITTVRRRRNEKEKIIMDLFGNFIDNCRN